MNLIGVQLDIVWENRQANFDKVHALLEEEPIEPGSLIVLPEMFSTGFSMNVDAICEGQAAETEGFLSELARETHSTILGGVVTKTTEGRGRNEAVVFDEMGKEITRYCKLHPFSLAGETEHYEPGEEIRTFTWNGFTVSPLICYDLRFPEAYRACVKEGATLFAVIANWPEAREYHWNTLLRARAIENQAYAIGVNRCGADPKNTYSGQSTIVDPWGEAMAAAGSKECVIQSQPDLDGLREYRDEFPVLSDMRDLARG